MPTQLEKDEPSFTVLKPRHHFGVWVFSVVLMVLVLLSVLAWQVALSYQNQKEIALSGLQLHARAIERDLERAIQLGERTLLELRLRGISSFDPPLAAKNLRSRLLANTFLEDIAFYSVDGTMFAHGGTRPSTILAPDSPPDWAVMTVSGGVATSYGAVNGFLGLAHRLDDPGKQASVGGLLLLFKPLELLQPSEQSAQGATFLIDPKGTVLLGLVGDQLISGGHITDYEPCKGLDFSTFESQGLRFVEDERWLRVLKQLDGQPFRLILTIPRDQAFAGWTRQLGGVIALAAAAIVGLGLLALLWRREQNAERRASYLRSVAEDEVFKKTRALEQVNAELEQLAIAATHDLQEPLRVITVHSQLLERHLAKDLPGTSLNSLSFVMRAANDMRLRVDAMRLYLNAGGMPPAGQDQWPPQELSPVLDDVLSLLHKEITDGHAVVSVHALPAVCLGRSDLEMLFYQLIRNALLYQPQGQVAHVEVSAQMCVEQGQHYALITVSDNGLGIAVDYWQQIFSLFKRLHPKDVYPSVGMGLAICHRIVSHAGGQIWVQSSQVGQGSLFALRLPVAQDVRP